MYLFYSLHHSYFHRMYLQVIVTEDRTISNQTGGSLRAPDPVCMVVGGSLTQFTDLIYIKRCVQLCSIMVNVDCYQILVWYFPHNGFFQLCEYLSVSPAICSMPYFRKSMRILSYKTFTMTLCRSLAFELLRPLRKDMTLSFYSSFPDHKDTHTFYTLSLEKSVSIASKCFQHIRADSTLLSFKLGQLLQYPLCTYFPIP